MSIAGSTRPPTEVIGAVTKREVVLSLILPLLAFFAINVWFARYLNENDPNLGYVIANQQWQKFSDLQESVDWLILGDSSCGAGIVLELIEQELGGTAAEFCVVGDMLVVNSAWMLQEYLQNFGPPKGVFIIHVYDIWSRDETNLKAYMAAVDFPDSFEQRAIPHIPLTLGDQFRLKTSSFLPLVWRPFSVRQIVENSVSFQRDIATDNKELVAETQAVNLFNEDVVFHITLTRRNEFQIGQKNQEAIHQLSTLANQYQFDLNLVIAPLYESLFEHGTFQRYYEQVIRTLDVVTEENPRMHILFPEALRLPREYLDNSVDHTNAAGARLFTQALIEEVLHLNLPAQ